VEKEETGGRGQGGGREHGWRKTRVGDADVGGEPFQEGGARPEGGVMTAICDTGEKTSAGALSRWTGQDCVFERVRFQTAVGAGGGRLTGSP